jgi:hypothetical protein
MSISDAQYAMLREAGVNNLSLLRLDGLEGDFQILSYVPPLTPSFIRQYTWRDLFVDLCGRGVFTITDPFGPSSLMTLHEAQYYLNNYWWLVQSPGEAELFRDIRYLSKGILPANLKYIREAAVPLKRSGVDAAQRALIKAVLKLRRKAAKLFVARYRRYFSQHGLQLIAKEYVTQYRKCQDPVDLGATIKSDCQRFIAGKSLWLQSPVLHDWYSITGSKAGAEWLSTTINRYAAKELVK